MTTATLTNRHNNQTARITLRLSGKLLSASSRQYNAALRKLGHGPIASDTSFIVLTAAGHMYAGVDQTAQ